MTSHPRPRILFICGSLNQTKMMHAVARHLGHADCRFTPFYTDGVLRWMVRKRLLEFTIMGGAMRRMTEAYLAEHQLPVDERGELAGGYDLAVTCSDLVLQRNIRGLPLVLVQEGMTDPEGLSYRIVRKLKLPRWLASTATTGLSHGYARFCVASPGYRDHFIAKGVPAERLVVTGIPNFDNCAAFLQNDFPHRGYVLVATSDTRETFKADRRARFFNSVERHARGRPLLFKLHPNENVARASAEIAARFPGAPIYSTGNAEQMIANCEALITQYSTVVYVGLALGKECYSYFDLEALRQMVPIQNGGRSGQNIAAVCAEVLQAAETAPWQAAS